MSFIPVSPESHFPIQNLPYGVFSTADNVRVVEKDNLYFVNTVTVTLHCDVSVTQLCSVTVSITQ